MELQNGRPADAAGRMDKEIRTYDFLDSLGVDYQRMDHEAALQWKHAKRSMRHLAWKCAKICFCATGRRRIFICF